MSFIAKEHHTVSTQPCHRPWTSTPHRAHLFTRWECTLSFSKLIYLFVPATQQRISSYDNNNRNAALWLVCSDYCYLVYLMHLSLLQLLFLMLLMNS